MDEVWKRFKEIRDNDKLNPAEKIEMIGALLWSELNKTR